MLGRGQEPDVDVGPEAVGRGGVVRAVRLVEREDRRAEQAERLTDGPGQSAEAAEMPDDDAPAGQRPGRRG